MTSSSITPRGRHRAEVVVVKTKKTWRQFAGLGVVSLLVLAIGVAAAVIR